jgi:hypothetical protein
MSSDSEQETIDIKQAIQKTIEVSKQPIEQDLKKTSVAFQGLAAGPQTL